MVEKLKIPSPLPKPRDLGKDFLGRSIGSYTPIEYKLYRERDDNLALLRAKSRLFRDRQRKVWEREKAGNSDSKPEGSLGENIEELREDEIREERARRREISQLRGKGIVFLCLHVSDRC